MATDEPLFLHGDLDLKIVEAKHLPNMDMFSERLRRCFTACDSCAAAPTPQELEEEKDRSSGGGRENRSSGGGRERKVDRHHNPRIITSDAYVTVCVPQATVARTRVIKNARFPRWEESFRVQLAHRAAHLQFQVKDDDVFGAQLIGTVNIPAEKILSGEHISDWFPVVGSSGKPPKPGSALYLDFKFTPCDKNPLYKHGIASDPERRGVRNTYFPLRKGCSVKLYQDAHVSHEKMPEIELDGGRVYQQGHCWEDICYAISEAHHLVYIVGWSIFHKVKLVREPTRPLPRGGDLTLGEMLKYKSQEGVRVLLLVWDDKTSHDKLLAGVMATHDEETKKFFNHSSVNCVLSPRYASSKLGYLKQQIVGTVFTHHQKCVLVDTQASGNNRKITAFLGGLDMCDGRYDTPEHRLFRDLDTVYDNDFHNPTFPAGTKAPRQPWHDLHSRVDGPAAYDVLINFEQRWRKATKWTELSLRLKKVSHWHDDAMIKIDRISWILSPSVPKSGSGTTSTRTSHTTSTRTSHKTHTTTTIPEDDPTLWVSREDDHENWHVQIFRSIDSGSVKGFPTSIDVAKSQNLMCSKDLVIDRSIQTAYIQAIRSAQHFIYIENQYFLGSSYAWPSYEYAGADNLVPMELALKIASKIRAKERFAVYIVIPMWPEGDTNSGAVQEILFWQNQTMQMMYGVIAQELKNMQLDYDPQDYLNFYCLGNREKLPEEKLRENTELSANGVKISDSETYQRFMIYVHAKGMIVDDEYVLIGSANINQRSLAGTKDTEIAMGAYQPHYTWSEKKRHPKGQIYGYRMSLWAEHLGMLESCFNEPESLDCVKTVNSVGEENWARFNIESFTLLQGHLLKYPVKVDKDGKVGPLPGHETFPDVGGKIVGTYSNTIPDVLTT